ncbi:hypothetical protein HPB50_024299 [Hyalomma asiaticum]|uniref:Uncharacterized protein n=1 Tax=Hyalomma asiaticum TaxID=266040 RepID=A0ACB7S1C5_HYAAI|nr:hypothetical protein HPB50_024299 [Hyalomma asiaticum]
MLGKEDMCQYHASVLTMLIYELLVLSKADAVEPPEHFLLVLLPDELIALSHSELSLLLVELGKAKRLALFIMEHLAKFIQVGPSNALFSQIRFIQPNDDWLSIRRFKAIEVKLCNVLEKKLPDVVSQKPGALESVNGDLTVEDVKVTYNMKKRSNLPSFVMLARKDDAKWEARKAKHVDESICKFKDYGGMFERKAVLKSELTVSIRRLTASELAQQAKVKKSQTTQDKAPREISGYFQPTSVPRPKTPDEKAALKRLLDRREAKKRHLSSSDSESNSASENFEAHKSKRHDRKLAPPSRSETPKELQQGGGR